MFIVVVKGVVVFDMLLEVDAREVDAELGGELNVVEDFKLAELETGVEVEVEAELGNIAD